MKKTIVEHEGRKFIITVQAVPGDSRQVPESLMRQVYDLGDRTVYRCETDADVSRRNNQE